MSGAAATSSARLLNQIVRKANKLSPVLSGRSFSPAAVDVEGEFSALHSLVNQVSLKELEMELPDRKEWLSQIQFRDFPSQPCYYTQIYQSEEVNVCAFSLREPGCELPAHNHPDMHGILKVLNGKVRLTSYSWLSPEQIRHLGSPERCLPPSGFERHLTRPEREKVRPVVFEGQVVLSAEDPAALVGPRLGNVHRVEAMSEVAAFFDVLMPPYDPKSAERDCQYFEPLIPLKPEEMDLAYEGLRIPNLMWLLHVPPPRRYWCLDWPYSGPPVHDKEEPE